MKILVSLMMIIMMIVFAIITRCQVNVVQPAKKLIIDHDSDNSHDADHHDHDQHHPDHDHHHNNHQVCRVDMVQPAKRIHNFIRGLDSSPGPLTQTSS